MIEEYCRSGIYERCEREDPEPPLIHLRGKKKQERRNFPEYFIRANKYMVYEPGFAKRMVHEPAGSPLRLAAGLFSRNGEIIAQAYIESRFDGNWYTAITESGTFENLMTGFKDYFGLRRRQFMDKTIEEIAEGVKNGTISKRRTLTPSSHGGVANLLKVLTNTMHQQGSSIRTIAKVQYTICTQAGILIPDEFITDVLVAADMVPNLWESDRKKVDKLNGVN